MAYLLSAVEGFDEGQAGKTTRLSGVRVKDQYTLEVRLRYPWADFPAVVSHPTLAPVPKEEVEKDPKAFSERPVGNGPFKMAEPWKHNEYIKLVRFNDYYGQKAYLDSVTFRIFDQREAAWQEFEAGNLDFTTIPTAAVAGGQFQKLKDEYGLGQYESKPGQGVLNGTELAIYYYAFNMESSPWKDKSELRRAISLAIDREDICRRVYRGTREPAVGVVPPGIQGFKKSVSGYTKRDAAKAKELLTKAGYPDGRGPDGLPLKLQISTNSGHGHEEPAQIILQNLLEIGIEATITVARDDDYLEAGTKGQLEFFRLGWIADSPTLDVFLYPLFHSRNISTEDNGFFGDNRSRYNDPEVDKLLDGARKETDKKKRMKMYQKAEKMVLDDAVIVPVAVYRHQHVVAKRVRGLVYSAQNIADLNKAWISTR